MTVQEAARRLEVSAGLVYKLCHLGKLGHRRIGAGRGVIRIDEKHLADFKERCNVELASEDQGPVTKKVRGQTIVIPDGFGRAAAALKRWREEERARGKAERLLHDEKRPKPKTKAG
jgi:excisionase family DNA binding protein